MFRFLKIINLNGKLKNMEEPIKLKIILKMNDTRI